MDGAGATIVVDGATYALTENFDCTAITRVTPMSLGFRGESVDGSVRSSATLPQAVDVIVGDEWYQVIGGAGDLSVETFEEGGLVIGRASGTAEKTDGSGPTVAFNLSVACPPN